MTAIEPERRGVAPLDARGRDVVIVGGGPAGLVTALALCRAAPALAPRILVLERGAYPRDKPCAGALGGRGVRLLEELGALPDTPFLPVNGMSLAGAGGRVEARVPAIGRVVRRLELDAALAALARDRGIAIRDATAVDTIRADGSRAIVETRAGSVRARVVIGADGVGSRVRRAMGTPAGSLRAQVLEVDTQRLPGEAADVLHFDASERDLPGYYWDFPTPLGGRAMVSRGVYHLTLASRVDLEARLAGRLARLGLDLARYPRRRFAERGFERPERLALGPMMLVGEAAGVDPITGEGIAQAIEYGVLAGEFLPAVLAGKRPLEAWTTEVHRSRLGLDLAARSALARVFFGPSRPAVERLFLQHPSVLRAGCRHFGGQPQRLADLGATLFSAVRALLGGLA